MQNILKLLRDYISELDIFVTDVDQPFYVEKTSPYYVVPEKYTINIKRIYLKDEVYDRWIDMNDITHQCQKDFSNFTIFFKKKIDTTIELRLQFT